jgi:hypothetical protein
MGMEFVPAKRSMHQQMKRTHMAQFDLGKYWDLFPQALELKYGTRFKEGFARIEMRFSAVQSGSPLGFQDVLSIFEPDLPFVVDWTKPDWNDLEPRMLKESAARSIATLLRSPGYDSSLSRDRANELKILGVFGEHRTEVAVEGHVVADEHACRPSGRAASSCRGCCGARGRIGTLRMSRRVPSGRTSCRHP